MVLVSKARSDRLWETHQAASSKYDYFSAGLCTALTAFVAQGLPASPFAAGWAIGLEVASSVLLCAAVAFSLLRIRAQVAVLGANQQALSHGERRDTVASVLAESTGEPQFDYNHTGVTLTYDQMRQHRDDLHRGADALRGQAAKWGGRAARAYRARDYALAAGLFLYVASRIVRVYA